MIYVACWVNFGLLISVFSHAMVHESENLAGGCAHAYSGNCPSVRFCATTVVFVAVINSNACVLLSSTIMRTCCCLQLLCVCVAVINSYVLQSSTLVLLNRMCVRCYHQLMCVSVSIINISHVCWGQLVVSVAIINF